MKFLMKIVSIVFVLSLPLLANGVAKITALKGSVEIQSASVSINATLGASLQEKDSIITADKSKAQIIFNDETIVTVGKNSNFSIAKYLFDDKSEPIVEFSMFKGAMKAITGRIGKIAPQKFKVKTKTATIGIRGTNFTVISMEDGSMRAYCTYGAISVTIDNKEFIVNQGFYLSLSKNGKVVVKEFSADELKEMDSKSFGERTPLKGGDSNQGAEPDNTQEDFNRIVIKELDEKVQDAVQTADAQNGAISLYGWMADTDAYTSMYSRVSLNFTEDGSSFDSSNSWVEVYNKSNASTNGEQDNWNFYLKETPDTFTSKNNFTTSFSSVYLNPLGTSTSQDAQLVSSSFSSTTDISEEDYVSWGTWNAEVNYKYQDPYSGLLQNATHNLSGLWVAGEATSADVISARTQTAYYIGKYQALKINASAPTVEFGDVSLNVDFGADQATLTINDNSNTNGSVNSTYTYNNMVVSGHAINGGTISAGTGSANGTFYGEGGENVGGNFYIDDGATGTSVKGVYEVREETLSQPY